MSENPTYDELVRRVRELEDAVADRRKIETLLHENVPFRKNVLKTLPVGISYAKDRKIMWANQAMEQLFGFQNEEEYLGMDSAHLYASQEEYARIGKLLYSQKREEQVIDCDARFLRKDGTTFHGFVRIIPIDSDDAKQGIIVSVVDITARKQAEEALRKSEARYRTIYENSGTATLTIQADTTIAMVNREYEKLSGLPREQIEGKMRWTDFVVPDDLADMVLYHKERRRTGSSPPRKYEFRFVDKDGNVKHVLNTVSLIPGTTDSIASLIDISQRKAAEEHLRESEEFYTRLVATMPDIVLRMDLEGNILFVSDAALSISGYARGELVGQNMLSFIAPKDQERAIANNVRMLSGQIGPRSYHLLMKNGDIRLFEVNGDVLRNDDGSPYGIVNVMRDTTERDRAEKALRQSEEHYRAVLETSPDPIVAYDNTGKVTYVNPAFTHVFGWGLEELLHKRTTYVPAEELTQTRAMIEKVRRGENFSRFETRRFTKDGSVVDISMSAAILRDNEGQPVGSVITLRDITEQKKLERLLLQAHKMEAIGTLAGGIAHDFNNLLMGIQGRASLVSVDLDRSHPHKEHISAIEAYVRSATGLTQQLLGFARGGKYEIKPTDINHLVAGSAHMFGRTKKEIRIHEKLEPDPIIVAVDRRQIEQVFFNLFINAWQAMPEGGNLYLETRIVMLDDAYCKPYQNKPGPYAKISVTDSGIGMAPSIRQQIFDPFFTTKDKGRGTGLGLASAYGIIKNHGGMITVYSEVGHGTTFNIFLPLSDQDAHREETREEGLIKGYETILLIDDEAMILDVGAAMLKKLDYTVISADSGEKAIELIGKAERPIDLILLDLIMPGMDGGETFDRIRKLAPELPVIIASGYAMDGKAADIMARGANGFIQKPFTILELSKKVRDVIDGV